MKYMSRLGAAAALFWVSGLASAGAASLLDQVTLVSDATVAGDPVPPAQTFTIAQSGSYTVTLTDLQLPTALAALSLAIADSTGTQVALSAAGQKTVALPAGTYTAQVLALAASGAVGGAFGVQLTPAAGGAAVWQYSDAIGAASPPPSSGQSVLSTKFTVTAAGSYQLTVSDLSFPVALSSLQLVILNDCGTTPGCVTSPVSPTPAVGPAISVPLTLAAGNYDLFVIAGADTTALQGLYSIQIAAAGNVLYATTVPVGQLPAAIAIPVPAAGSVALQLVDLASPAALASIQAVVTQGAGVLQQLSGAGTTSFAAAAGPLQLYVLGQPGGSTGQGSFEAYATSGTQTLADVAQPVLAPGSFGYEFSANVPAATYQAGIYDFQLPQAFSSLNAVVAQGGVVLTTTTSSSGTFAAVAGPINFLVFPAFASATANGLFGAQLVAAGANGAAAFQATQGVGALFSAYTFTVSTAGTYNLTLTDLLFPAKFTSLAVIATRGYSLAGQVEGGGTQAITATPGTYVLNVFAQVAGSGVDYGLYGLNVSPAPSVTLTAAASSVASGGQTTLTWLSSNTTGCTASSSPGAAGWNGALSATSGSQATGALTAATTFQITCTGPNGATAVATTSVAVTTAPKSGGGGGGGLTFTTVLALLLMTIPSVLRRRRLALGRRHALATDEGFKTYRHQE
jgi:hypothetical protein